MKRTKTPFASKKIKGIYFRQERDAFWFTRMRRGKRVYVDLETNNYVEAVKRAALIQDSPELNPAQGWQGDVDAFIASREHLNEWSPNSAKSKRTVLETFGEQYEGRKPHQFTEKEAQRFYENQSRQSPVTFGESDDPLAAQLRALLDDINNTKL